MRWLMICYSALVCVCVLCVADDVWGWMGGGILSDEDKDSRGSLNTHRHTHPYIHTYPSEHVNLCGPAPSTGNSWKPRLSLHGDALRADGTTGVRGHKETEGKAKLSFLLGAVIMAAPEYSRIQLNIWNLIWDSGIIFIFPWKILSISLKRPKPFQESGKPLKDWVIQSIWKNPGSEIKFSLKDPEDHGQDLFDSLIAQFSIFNCWRISMYLKMFHKLLTCGIYFGLHEHLYWLLVLKKV